MHVTQADPPLTSRPVDLRDSSERWYLAALLFAGMFLCYAQRGALSVAVPFLINDLHLSATITGVLLSAFFWSYALLQVPAGWLTDRFGACRVYTVGMLICGLACAASGLAGSLASLIVFRVLIGAGQSVAFPATSRAVANWFLDRERGTVSAIYLCGVRFGQAAVIWVGAIWIPVFGWKLFFLLIGLLTLLWVLPWRGFLSSRESQERAVAPRRAEFSFGRGLAILRKPTVLGIFLGFFAYDYAWFLYAAWLPTYLVRERHFTSQEMGVLSAAPYLLMSVVILASGFLSDLLIRRGVAEIKVRKLFIIVGMLVGCLIVPAGLVQDRMSAIWLITLSLCGLGICAPNTWTLTHAVCSKSITGTVTGIQNFGGNIGGVIAPVLTGYIADVTHSFALALGLTGGILVAGMLCYLLLVRDPVESA